MENLKLPRSVKFLDAYDKRDLEFYFGREETVPQLFDRVGKSNLTVVYGFSGTGKTSLIQCGLANQFCDSDWMEVVVRKRRNLTMNGCTFEAIQSKAKTSLMLPENRKVNADFLLACLNSLYLDYFRTIYLIYDQFEELFIQSSERDRQAFGYFLRRCLSSKLNVKVIIVIREEYLGSLDEFEQMIPNFMENCFRLERMSKKTIKTVMGKILRDNGIIEYENLDNYEGENMVTIEELDEEELNAFKQEELGYRKEHFMSSASNEATETLLSEECVDVRDLIYDNIKDTSTKTVDLPYMQVYLDKLIRKLPEQTFRLTKEHVDSVGKLDDVLAVFLDESVEGIAAKVNCKREDLWTALNCLVSVDGTKQGLKLEEIKTALDIINE